MCKFCIDHCCVVDDDDVVCFFIPVEIVDVMDPRGYLFLCSTDFAKLVFTLRYVKSYMSKYQCVCTL